MVNGRRGMWESICFSCLLQGEDLFRAWSVSTTEDSPLPRGGESAQSSQAPTPRNESSPPSHAPQPPPPHPPPRFPHLPPPVPTAQQGLQKIHHAPSTPPPPHPLHDADAPHARQAGLDHAREPARKIRIQNLLLVRVHESLPEPGFQHALPARFEHEAHRR